MLVDVPVATPAWLAGVLVAALLAAATGLLTGRALRALGVQARVELATAGPEDDRPPDYAGLASVRWSVAVGLTSAGAGLLVVLGTPLLAWPVWCALATVGVLLGWIDAATTWLPLTPTHLLWLGTAVGTVVASAVAAATGRPDWWWMPLGAGLGALCYAGFLALVWLLSRGQLGFGDVRLAVALGAATGAVSLQTTFLAALVGTASAAVWGLVQLVRRQRDPIPYGPFLLLGAFVAPLLT